MNHPVRAVLMTIFAYGNFPIRERLTYFYQLVPMSEKCSDWLRDNGWPGVTTRMPLTTAWALIFKLIDFWPAAAVAAVPGNPNSADITFNAGSPTLPTVNFTVSLDGVTFATVRAAANQLTPVSDQLATAALRIYLDYMTKMEQEQPQLVNATPVQRLQALMQSFARFNENMFNKRWPRA
mmetsp:Transcript_11319/g.22983  ORF Transcript_11319/g.22983 Transcript_11319/m.22983 type:complete len:180 (+) Transcript_11319:92-631(+)